MAPLSTPRARRRRSGSVVLLRRVDVDSPVHRLWAGTKLLAVAALSVTLSYRPSWSAIGVVAALLVGGTLAARVPAAALPRPPRWLLIGLLLGALLTLVAGGSPELRLGPAHVGLGDLLSYVQFVAITVELLGGAALVGWTTALGDVAPAVATLGRPLRVLRVPVEEWAVTIALCIRALPLLVGELRVVVAARRLRPRPPEQGVGGWIADLQEMVVATLTVSLRRAAEMGEAMRARGGLGGLTARVARPGRPDLWAGLVVAAACAAAWLLPGYGLSA